MQIDAYVPASKGEISEHYDELLELTGTDNKSLIEFNGKPMIEYVLDALNKAETIKSITIVGQTEESLPYDADKPVYYIEGGTSTFKTTMKAVSFFEQKEDASEYILSLSSDLPLISSEMIDLTINSIDFSKGKEYYWNLVLAEDVRNHYPEVTKVPFKLKEAIFLFGDLQILKPSVVKGREDALRKIMENRKSVFSAIKLISLSGIIKYIFGRLSVDDIQSRVKKKFNLNAAMLITEFPEACVDLDYAKDYHKFKKWLADTKRELEEGERIVVVEKHEELMEYLDSRNYTKSVQ